LQRIREQEQAAIVHRVEGLEIDVERQRTRENNLQRKYAELMKRKEQLLLEND